MTRSRSQALLAVVLLLAACQHSAQPTRIQTIRLEPARAALRQGDAERAVQIYRDLAEDDIAAAQYELARLYEQGTGTPRDAASAAEWYRRAANAGYERAYRPLAKLFERGEGLEADPERAFRLNQLAAERGDTGCPPRTRRSLRAGPGRAA